MKSIRSNRIVCAIAALAMGTSSGWAVAQNDKDMRADRAARAEARGHPNPGVPDGRYDRRSHGDDGRYDRRAPAGRAAWGGPRGPRDGRGAGPEHGWYRGGRLPPAYRGREYVVDDWRGYHLQPPPRGYQWVDVGGDFLLVAVATGIIASILLNQ